MKSDINACSICQSGKEQYESYPHPFKRDIVLVQYDYRAADGKLFSTCAPSLEIARQRRDNWLAK
jgi:hypothetical protein